jgi:hypothetical protein
MAMTTRSSMSVKPGRRNRFMLFSLCPRAKDQTASRCDRNFH